jgi:hypothetical protein
MCSVCWEITCNASSSGVQLLACLQTFHAFLQLKTGTCARLGSRTPAAAAPGLRRELVAMEDGDEPARWRRWGRRGALAVRRVAAARGLDADNSHLGPRALGGEASIRTWHRSQCAWAVAPWPGEGSQWEQDGGWWQSSLMYQRRLINAVVD